MDSAIIGLIGGLIGSLITLVIGLLTTRFSYNNLFGRDCAGTGQLIHKHHSELPGRRHFGDGHARAGAQMLRAEHHDAGRRDRRLHRCRSHPRDFCPRGRGRHGRVHRQ